MGLHDGHRKRLKQQFLSQGEHLHDHQLLELLLCYAIPQKDTNGLAHQLLDRFGSLAGIFDALPASLMHESGIGEHAAVLLKLVPLLSGRYTTARSALGTMLTTTQAAGAYLRPYFCSATRNETVYLVCMDSKYKVLNCQKISEGTASYADLPPRKVLETALSLNATTVILAHNHISGLALPSQPDLTATEQLVTILNAVGIELVDHLIFTEDDMVSLRDSGLVAGSV